MDITVLSYCCYLLEMGINEVIDFAKKIKGKFDINILYTCEHNSLLRQVATKLFSTPLALYRFSNAVKKAVGLWIVRPIITPCNGANNRL